MWLPVIAHPLMGLQSRLGSMRGCANKPTGKQSKESMRHVVQGEIDMLQRSRNAEIHSCQESFMMR